MALVVLDYVPLTLNFPAACHILPGQLKTGGIGTAVGQHVTTLIYKSAKPHLAKTYCIIH